MDELEGLVEPRCIEKDGEREYDEGDVRGKKRARIEDAGIPVPQEEKAAATAPPAVAMGLLSADAVESLRYMASLRQQSASAVKVLQKKVIPAPVIGLGSLAGYGSDSD